MATEQLANNAVTTLAGNGGSITAGATTLNVANAAQFPATGNFRILIGSELLLVTAVAGLTFTVTRQIESTSAASHNDGDAVTHILTAGGLIQVITDTAPPGGVALLEEHTASASASLDFTTRNVPRQSGTLFQSYYDVYRFDFINLIPTTAGDQLWMRMNTGSGFDTGSNYTWSGWRWFSLGDGTSGGADTKIVLVLAQSKTLTPGTFSTVGSLTLVNPQSVINKSIIGQFTSPDSGAGSILGTVLLAAYLTSSPLTQVQFKMSTGTIASGTIRAFGHAK